MSQLEIFQAKLDELRAKLAKTEEWEEIDDIKWMKFYSPKWVSYRRSKAYAALKRLRSRLDGDKCIKCDSTTRLHFHHVIYERLYRELLTDGRTLCSNCHSVGHDAGREIYSSELFNTEEYSNESQTEEKIMTDQTKTKKRTFQEQDLSVQKQQEMLSKHRDLMVWWLEKYLTARRNNTEKKKIDFSKNIDAIWAAEKHGRLVSTIAKIRHSAGVTRSIMNNKDEVSPILGLNRLWSALNAELSINASNDIGKFVQKEVTAALKGYDSPVQMQVANVPSATSAEVKRPISAFPAFSVERAMQIYEESLTKQIEAQAEKDMKDILGRK